jgi:DNA (cytosine-5)-methyltransferase 1
MPPRAYYNENDKKAAHVLRCLSDEGLIMPGDVDDRSIKDVQPDDLKGYTQCHMFAGAGLWPLAARLAGWPDRRPIWTGSCPCQPFSGAGKGLGTDDPRHLWPDFFRLIRACRPPVIMGEQVAGSAGYGWFDGVASDLEGEGIASRTVDIPACAVDSPQIRQRLFWCAVAGGGRGGNEPWLRSGETSRAPCPDEGEAREWQRSGRDDWLSAGDLEHGSRLGRREGRPEHELRSRRPAIAGADVCDLAAADGAGLAPRSIEADQRRVVRIEGTPAIQDDDRGVWRNSRRNGSAWAGAEWIACHDGKARRTESGLRLLVNGMAGRIPAWRLAGNSISPILAAEVIGAFLDAEELGASA